MYNIIIAKMTDIPMMISTLIFIIPLYSHFQHGELFECIMICAVIITSLLSDSICYTGKYAKLVNTIDRIVAPLTLFVILRRSFIIHSILIHRMYICCAVLCGLFCLYKARNAPNLSLQYRIYHILWHLTLVSTNVLITFNRPNY